MAFLYSVRKKDYWFDPKKHHEKSETPYTISRSRIDLFVECPLCFYLSERYGVKRPDSYPLTLNNAVDELLKREFDVARNDGVAHPLMRTYNIDAVPLRHKNLPIWRDALKAGIAYRDPKTNLYVRGGIDDVWINTHGELHIVDYKATSKKEEVNLDAEWQDAYKRQVEVYQWLFIQNGFSVSPIAYFVYVNGNSDAATFDGKLEFTTTVIPYTGDTRWIPKTLRDIHACLMAPHVPDANPTCSYCAYRQAAGKVVLADALARKKEKPS